MHPTYCYNLGLAFQQVARAVPDQPALIFSAQETTSYAELNAMANRLARLFQRHGVTGRDVVALLNHKSIAGFAAMLACLKLGATYTNLDDENPLARLQHMIATARPTLLAADQPPNQAARQAAETNQLDILDLSASTGDIASLPDSDLPETVAVHGGMAAYLMFTSGSTGKPKGVAISHASVLNFAAWSRQQYDIRQTDRLTNVNPIYFDNSVFDFYSALLNGAALVPFSSDLVRNPGQMIAHATACGCTIWFSVPSLLIYAMRMKALAADSLPALRIISFGGEGFPIPQLRQLYGLYSARVRFYNVYGPTECTCICSSVEVTDQELTSGQGLPPLGPIAPNFHYHVLDENDAPVEPGEVGELVLGGPQVGLGYYGESDKTAATFPQDPLNPEFPQRVYRTGDLVREDARRWLHFVGRKDNQIKHMGYRIELDEIEAILNAIPGIEEAAAIYLRETSEFGRIIGFIATRAAVDTANLCETLKQRLPHYMIPHRIETLESLPKSPNGKIDRQQLATRSKS